MKLPPTGPHYLHLDLKPYEGKYIALVEGRVTAVASTAQGAFARARRSRPQRMPVVIKVADCRHSSVQEDHNSHSSR